MISSLSTCKSVPCRLTRTARLAGLRSETSFSASWATMSENWALRSTLSMSVADLRSTRSPTSPRSRLKPSRSCKAWGTCFARAARSTRPSSVAVIPAVPTIGALADSVATGLVTFQAMDRPRPRGLIDVPDGLDAIEPQTIAGQGRASHVELEQSRIPLEVPAAPFLKHRHLAVELPEGGDARPARTERPVMRQDIQRQVGGRPPFALRSYFPSTPRVDAEDPVPFAIRSRTLIGPAAAVVATVRSNRSTVSGSMSSGARSWSLPLTTLRVTSISGSPFDSGAGL